MSPVEKALDTRHVYSWEATAFSGAKQLRMDTLRRLTRRIWKDAGRTDPLPKVIAGRGTLYHGRLYSYYEDGLIVLARNQRQSFVLIHELVHALGYDDHDAPFQRRYRDLLRRYLPREMRRIDATLPLVISRRRARR